MSRTIWQRIARWWVRRSKSRSRHRDDLGPKSHWTTNAHYQNYGCEQISSEDIPIIFWRYFYVTNRYDNLELVDLYSDVENDPNKPRTLQELSIIMARERLKFWLNYKMSLFSFHYCDFVKLQNILLTTIGIQLAISNWFYRRYGNRDTPWNFLITWCSVNDLEFFFLENCDVTQASSMVITQITLVQNSLPMSMFYGLVCLL